MALTISIVINNFQPYFLKLNFALTLLLIFNIAIAIALDFRKFAEFVSIENHVSKYQHNRQNLP